MTRHLERPSLTAEEIDIEISKEKERLEAVQRAAPEKIGSDIGRQIVLLEKEKVAAADDPDSRQKAAQQLIELKQAVDSLQKSAEWELLVADFEGYRAFYSAISGGQRYRRPAARITTTSQKCRRCCQGAEHRESS